MFFYKGWSVLLPRRGAPIYNWKKLQLEKLKKDYVQIQKVKIKTITNESLPVPDVIDQCSRGDRTCG